MNSILHHRLKLWQWAICQVTELCPDNLTRPWFIVWILLLTKSDLFCFWFWNSILVMVDLALAVYPNVVLNFQWTSCLCLLSTWITGVYCHAPEGTLRTLVAYSFLQGGCWLVQGHTASNTRPDPYSLNSQSLSFPLLQATFHCQQRLPRYNYETVINLKWWVKCDIQKSSPTCMKELLCGFVLLSTLLANTIKTLWAIQINPLSHRSRLHNPV